MASGRRVTTYYLSVPFRVLDWPPMPRLRPQNTVCWGWMIRRIPAIALVAVLAAAPIASCVLAVRTHAAMAMATGDDCGTQRADQTPAFCAPEMVAASGLSMASVPAAAMPAYAGALRRAPDIIARVTVVAHDTGPPGSRPPAWLRHNAFLI